MRVKVYFNLHKKVWSVLGMTPKGWRLLKHVPSLMLYDVTWKVSEAGRQRVLREKRKNVHAFAIGTLAENVTTFKQGVEWHGIRYNPYEGPYFQADGYPIAKSQQACFMENRQVFACISSVA